MTGAVLIIEDEKELSQLITLYLDREGISSRSAGSAEEGLLLLEEKSFDLVILDINLPGMDGFEFLQKFRKSRDTPVMILSAREADEDIIMGLGIGADEFVTKPFAPRVLTARVRAHLRRGREEPASRELFRFGPWELDPEGFHLKKEGTIVTLSVKEFEVLRFLLQNAGKAFSSDELYEEVWGNRYGDTTAIPVYIQRLRKKIEEEYRSPRYILTRHGRGYLFDREMLT